MTRRNHLHLVESLPESKPTPPAEPNGPAIDLAAFRLDFENLCAQHGLRINFGSIAAMKDAPALLAATLFAYGANIDMPLSTYRRFQEVQEDLGKPLGSAKVLPQVKTGGA
jgi:hypothetical protein